MTVNFTTRSFSIVPLALAFSLSSAAQAQSSANDFYARGFARRDRGDLDGAIADYNRAILGAYARPGRAATSPVASLAHCGRHSHDP